MNTKTSNFNEQIQKSISERSFNKLTISKCSDKSSDLKKIVIRLIKLKDIDKLNFVYNYKTNHITKNYDINK